MKLQGIALEGMPLSSCEAPESMEHHTCVQIERPKRTLRYAQMQQRRHNPLFGRCRSSRRQ